MTQAASSRLRGRLKSYNKERRFGFLLVGYGSAPEEYHFHQDALRDPRKEPAKGVVYEFTPYALGIPGKCDKALDIVAVG